MIDLDQLDAQLEQALTEDVRAFLQSPTPRRSSMGAPAPIGVAAHDFRPPSPAPGGSRSNRLAASLSQRLASIDDEDFDDDFDDDYDDVDVDIDDQFDQDFEEQFPEHDRPAPPPSRPVAPTPPAPAAEPAASRPARARPPAARP